MAKPAVQHVPVPWHSLIKDPAGTAPATEATLPEKTTLVGRIGMMFLSVGTGAWRVRQSMNLVAEALGVVCSADVGLLTLELTCFDDSDSFTQVYSLRTSGVNTDKLNALQNMLVTFPEKASSMTVEEFHTMLDELDRHPANYKAPLIGLAAAIACCGFTFLLGGGLPEMICAFFGAGVGQYIRHQMVHRRISLLASIIVSVAAACLVYVGAITAAEAIFHLPAVHEAGYICAMLFVIPGFPLITGGIDIAKLDLRSGLERMSYALLIIIIATLTGYATAYLLHFQPADFIELQLPTALEIVLRLLCSFAGVFGFSMMFNSPPKMAAVAGCVGMIANTLRLELIDLAGLPAGIAALLGALTAGLLASVIQKQIGFPRISITVPSIVIMVPGLFMYRGIYLMAMTDIDDGLMWLTKAVLIVLALPLGLVLARILTDNDFRHCN